jgi:hypothetical protein
VDRRSVFRPAALESQAFGEIGDPHLSFPRWTIGGALALLIVLIAAVYTALTGSITLRPAECRNTGVNRSRTAACKIRIVHPIRDMLARSPGTSS